MRHMDAPEVMSLRKHTTGASLPVACARSVAPLVHRRSLCTSVGLSIDIQNMTLSCRRIESSLYSALYSTLYSAVGVITVVWSNVSQHLCRLSFSRGGPTG